ncbi:alpha-1,6-mannosyl-glycoprotein 2-beta-N-acetylglucosaminyltransferase-like [Pelobates fuscus]|uniref:alpha-1,6-mannosyl-glycoprotein 2-beta-N-acetylglucosaminyltransferase-like n=1 Tax=Pelobates fuscus TaxID=191477 RepID=UPI002FE42E4B
MRLTLHKKKIATLVFVLGMALCVWLLFFHTNDDSDAVLKLPYSTSWQNTYGLPDGSPEVMRLASYRMNLRQLVLNKEHFRGQSHLVVVVQVRGGPGSGSRLRLLAESLRAAGPGATSRLLLVLSIEKPCVEVYEAITSIDFCRVIPIFYPYSLSFYPNEFPGADPADCFRDLPKESAKLKGCNNAEFPDSYGHYREAAFTVDKHHWLWKLHYTWEKLQEVSGYSGYALFLDEGTYLLPDWLHMLRLMQKQCQEEGCHLLSLGGTTNSELSPNPPDVEVSTWVAPKHRSAIAMSRELYYKLMGCLAEFCTYDDYNWDWSLQHVSASCLAHPLRVLSTLLPRVLTLPAKEEDGVCGRTGPCESSEGASELLRVRVRELSGRLFPKTLAVTSRQQDVRNPPQRNNGGWGDIRDHVLCQSHARL